MFASKKNRADRTAHQAWEYLSEAMSTAGETAGTATGTATKLAGAAGRKSRRLASKASRRSSTLADRAGTTVTSVTEEAWIRANTAANALAGRRPARPWGLIVGIGLAGVAFGWAAASTARAALERQAENEELELAETAVVVTPTYDES